jgi:hypothetical protein
MEKPWITKIIVDRDAEKMYYIRCISRKIGWFFGGYRHCHAGL